MAQMQNGSVNEARDARDGLFALREEARPAAQKQIDAALLPALARELRAGRVAGGRYTIERILTAMGPAAGPMLLQVLEEPAAPYPAVVEVLSKIADPETEERRPRSWSSGRASGPNSPPDVARAGADRGQAVRSNSCTTRWRRGHERDAVLAAQALQQGPRSPALVTLAMRVAGNQRANKAVRDEMFGLLEYIGTPGGDARRDPHHRDRPDPLVRYRAYESGAGHRQGRGDGRRRWRRFPRRPTYKREDVVDFLVKDIQKIGAGTGQPGGGQGAGARRSPLARMTGVLALEALGTAADAPAVAKLAGDRASVKGFPAGAPWARKRRASREFCRTGQTVVNRERDRRSGPGSETERPADDR